MRTIVINSLKHGIHNVLVDDEDYEMVSQFKWYLFKNRYIYYAESYRLRKEYKIRCMHNLILQTKMVDHIDGNGLNNQRSNLRPCTNSKNQMNKRKRTIGTSVFKGVFYEKDRNKWRVSITLDGRRIRLGRYNTEKEAAQAYNEASIRYFGNFRLENTL